jgi:hypothetical protein
VEDLPAGLAFQQEGRTTWQLRQSWIKLRSAPVRTLIGYGCGKEGSGGHPGTQMDAAPGGDTYAEVRRAMSRPQLAQSPSAHAFNWIVSAPMKVVAEHSGFIIDAVTSLRAAELSAAGFD